MKYINKILKKHFIFLLALLLFTSGFTLVGSLKPQAAASETSDLFFDAITFDKKSPQALGSTINITAEATGSDLTYKFCFNCGVKISEDDEWQSFSQKGNPTYAWTPTIPGFYKIDIYIKDGDNNMVEKSTFYFIK